MNAAQARVHEAAVRLFAEKGTTHLSISELADAAGVARGTIYNNIESLDSLFMTVAGQLATEMHDRVIASTPPMLDPRERLARGIRFYVRRAHEEPNWGRFMNRFGLSNPALLSLWSGPPIQALHDGIESRLYDIRPDQVASVIAMTGGSVLAAMLLVLEGHRTWREAGADVAELVLRSLGVPATVARQLATSELPALTASPA